MSKSSGKIYKKFKEQLNYITLMLQALLPEGSVVDLAVDVDGMPANHQTEMVFELFKCGWSSHPHEKRDQILMLANFTNEGVFIPPRPRLHTSIGGVKKEQSIVSRTNTNGRSVILRTIEDESNDYVFDLRRKWQREFIDSQQFSKL